MIRLPQAVRRKNIVLALGRSTSPILDRAECFSRLFFAPSHLDCQLVPHIICHDMSVMRALKNAPSLSNSYADLSLCGSGEQQQDEAMSVLPVLEKTLHLHEQSPVDALVMVTDIIAPGDCQKAAHLMIEIKEKGIKVFTCSNFYDRLRDDNHATSVGAFYLMMARQTEGVFAPFTLRHMRVLGDYLFATGLAIAGRKPEDFRHFSSQISTPQGEEFFKTCLAKHLRSAMGSKSRVIAFAPRPPA